MYYELNSGGFIAVITCTTIFCVVYGYFKYAHSFWYRNNIPFVPGKFPFGSMTSVMLRKQTFLNGIGEIYETMKHKGHKYVGLYFFTRKALLLNDPEIIKNVLSTDFQYFTDRGIYYDEENDPLSAHLVALSGDKWRELRQKVSPTFSSGKLKTMFATVMKCAEQLVVLLNRQNKDEPFNAKDFTARYTTDVIGSCAFGIECNSLKNPNAEFRTIGKRIFQSTFADSIRRIIIRNFPKLARILKIRVINPEVSKFFVGIVKETIAYRRKEKVSRTDFLQLLMELMDKRNVDNEIEKRSVKFETAAVGKKDTSTSIVHLNGSLTLTQAAAHSFVFFLAGYETSASTITFALFELTTQTHIQDKVRTEIFEVVRKHNNMITYDCIMEMHYMERVLLETMRKYPTFILIMRKCTRDYNLPDINVKLEKGIPVIIPVHALHHDPQYYVDPEQFNPDRFQPENSKSRIDYTYLPFGYGPRICVGLRFAMIQMKMALTMMLMNFKFTLSEKTKLPLVFNPQSFVLMPLNTIWLNAEKLSKEDI